MASLMHSFRGKECSMRRLTDFLSRFRRKNDPMRPRTLAESEVEDLQGQGVETPEEKKFNEKKYEKAQEELHPDQVRE